MNNLSILTSTFSNNGYTKNTYKVRGSMTSNDALKLKNTINKWFNADADECVIDLSEATALDVVGVNLLVKMKIITCNSDTIFYVKAPYRSEIVDVLEQTKMKLLLNVILDIRNTIKLAS